MASDGEKFFKKRDFFFDHLSLPWFGIVGQFLLQVDKKALVTGIAFAPHLMLGLLLLRQRTADSNCAGCPIDDKMVRDRSGATMPSALRLS
ncbi:MAG: hypothetical protein AAFW98_13880, partial [Pseudomonadota bacterium]